MAEWGTVGEYVAAGVAVAAAGVAIWQARRARHSAEDASRALAEIAVNTRRGTAEWTVTGRGSGSYEVRNGTGEDAFDVELVDPGSVTHGDVGPWAHISAGGGFRFHRAESNWIASPPITVRWRRPDGTMGAFTSPT